MAVVIVPRIIPGKNYYRDTSESGDQIAIQGLVRSASGTADLYTDNNTTTLTIGGGSANTSTLLRSNSTIGFVTGGTERVRVGTDGAMVVGDTTIASPVPNSVFATRSTTLWLGGRVAETAPFSNVSFIGDRARGTLAAPQALQQHDLTAQIFGRAYIGPTTQYTAVAGIGFTVDGTPADGSSAPGRIVFQTVSAGSLSAAERMRLDSAGALRLGSAILNATTGLPATTIQLLGADAGESYTAHRVASSGGVAHAGGYVFQRARNTIASPQVVVSGDYLGAIYGQGYGGTTLNYGNAALISFHAEGTFTNTSSPGRVSFFTTPSGTTTLSERMRIDNAGIVRIGDPSIAPDSFATVSVAKNEYSILRMRGASNTAGTWPGFGTHRSRGTVSSPSAVQSGDTLANFVGGGYIGATTQFTTFGFISVSADAAPTDGSSAPGRVSVFTVPTGSLGGVERLRIDNSGYVRIGSSVVGQNVGLNSDLLVGGNNGASIYVITASDTAATAPTFGLTRTRSSLGSTAAVQSGDTLARLVFGGAVSLNAYAAAVEIRGYAEENFTGSTNAASLRLYTTPAGSPGTSVERWRLTSTGALEGRSSGSQLTWTTGLGAGPHVVGPTDQNLVIRSGTGRNLILGYSGSDTWAIINTTGQLQPGTTNTRDLGATGARIRTGYFGTSISVGTTNPLDVSEASISRTGAGISIGDSGQTVTFPGTINATEGLQANSLPVPVVLSVTSVDLAAVATTNLYTVPSGQSLIVTDVIVKPTTATAAVGDAQAGVGVAAGEVDIADQQTLSGLDATTELFRMALQNPAYVSAASEVVKFGVDVADTGTALVADVYLVGYLI